MKVIVLGSGASGGYPQWNCNCSQCAGLRNGSVRSSVRTQSSIAVSADGRRWVLLNASPDLAQQLRIQAALQPGRAGAARHSPIAAVVLLDAQIDHCAGLLSLREGPPIDLYCTPSVFEDLTTALPLLPALQHYCGVHWHLLPVAGETLVTDFRLEVLPGLRFHAMAISGRAPLYSGHHDDPSVGDNIVLLIEDLASGRQLLYAPALAQVGDAERRWMEAADCLLVDGTFWSDDELRRHGLAEATARELGHLPQCGAAGMIAALAGLGERRKVLTHVNNSNPILDEDSAERRELERHRIEVAYDGMEIDL